MLLCVVTSVFGWFPGCCYVWLLVCLGGFQCAAMCGY